MRTTFPVLTLVGVVIVLAGSNLVLRSSDNGVRESEVALAYACGYRNGQIAITSRVPSLFTDPKDKACLPDQSCSCPTVQAIAARHGFAD